MALGSTITQVTDSGIKPGITFPSFVSSGVATATNFKTGTTNVHNAGIELAGINVLGGNTPIGTGATIWRDGGAIFSGIVSATSFVGDISNATGAAAGLGTALSQTQTDPLNKIYYTDSVLSVGSTITINPPSSASAAYTQYTDIVATGDADIIVADGDDFVPDILGIATGTAVPYSGTGGRIRAGQFTNTSANGAPTATNGWIVTGVCTATTFKGNLTGTASQLETNATGANLTLSGNLGVGGTITYEDVARVDATGISTFREGLKIGPLAGIALTAYTDGSIRTSGIITASSFSGTVASSNLSGALPALDGSALTGVGVGTADSINTSGIITATAFIPTAGQLSHRNLIINGAMQVNQYGNKTGISADSMGGADRFRSHIVNLGTWTSSQVSSATDLNTTGFQHSFKMQNTTADASPAAGGYAVFIYRFEGYDVAPLRYGTASAKQVTLSFWCKANINGWSSGTKSFVAELQAAGGASESGQLVTLTTNDTWQKVELTYPGNTSTALNTTNGEALAMNLWLDSGSNFTSGSVSSAWSNKANADRAGGLNLGLGNNTANYFQITGVQLEIGSVATPFEYKSYLEELLRCQRYYFKITGDQNDMPGIIGFANSQSVARFIINFPAPMRQMPTFTGTGTMAFDSHNDSATFNCNDCSLVTNTHTTPNPVITSLQSPSTSSMANNAGGGVIFRSDGSSLAFNSEL